MIIFGIAVLVVGYVLSIPILETSGVVLLIIGLIVWILRQSQDVVLASLRYRPPPPGMSKLSLTVRDRRHRSDLTEAVAKPNGRKLTSGIGVTSQPLQRFST